MQRNTKKLLGFNVDSFTWGEAVEYATELMSENKGGHVITINPEMIELGCKNFEYAQTLLNADLVVADGVGIKLGLKLKGVNVERIAGVDFAHKLIEIASAQGFSVALVGAKPNVVQKAQDNLKAQFKNLNLVFVQDGYFENVAEVIDKMAKTQPQLVLVALGAPRQDEFIIEARKSCPNSLMIGVGGSFDVWSGLVERAPKICQKLGLEWLYRTIKEPQRFKRIFPTIPNFLIKVLISDK